MTEALLLHPLEMMDEKQNRVVVSFNAPEVTDFSADERNVLREKLISSYLAGDVSLLRRHIQSCPKCGQQCSFKAFDLTGAEVVRMVAACGICVRCQNGVELLIPSFFIHILAEHDCPLDSNLKLCLS